MKTYNISTDLKEKIFAVLNRRNVRYAVKGENQIDAKITANNFHKVVIRARMEYLQEQAGSSIPFISPKEIGDPIVMDEVGDEYIIKS